MLIDRLKELWPFLVPLIIIQFALMIMALTHVLRHKHYRVGSRALWIVVVVLINIIGPIAYFAFGRSDE
jgi:hypothetical protein